MKLNAERNTNMTNGYSYNGEFVNLDNVQVAFPIDDNHIKIFLKGSAGAGHSHKYDIQHREHVLVWPRKVWDAVIADASHIVTLVANGEKVKIK